MVRRYLHRSKAGMSNIDEVIDYLTYKTPEEQLMPYVRRVAYLAAHFLDREDSAVLLWRELHRLYKAVETYDGEEPDLTFCCGCREEIAADQTQWVVKGAKYHEACSKRVPVAEPVTEEHVERAAKIIAASPLIVWPTLPAECWRGLARQILEARR
jgi:hypothetical protein